MSRDVVNQINPIWLENRRTALQALYFFPPLFLILGLTFGLVGKRDLGMALFGLGLGLAVALMLTYVYWDRRISSKVKADATR